MSFKSSTGQIVRFSILVYWSIFWLFNVIDKLIGGSMYLWVGRDRFAQFQKYFASAGLDSPIIADAALIVAAGLEVFAFVFFAGALLHFLNKRADTSRSWFFFGIVFTLVTFTIFSIGDHIFGDRFELLEHTLFWFITLISWFVYNKLQGVEREDLGLVRRQKIGAGILAIFLVIMTSVSVFDYNENFFYRRNSALNTEIVGDNLYKISFPFLGGSKVFENSLAKFKEENPNLRIIQLYTVPNTLRLKKADSLIFYIVTEEKS